jgi:hypothetical protein
MNTNENADSRESTRFDVTVIKRISDKAAYEANMAAISTLVRTQKYHHIVAWGKFLGFTPETVKKSVSEAEAENAPADAIQKIDGRWRCLADIENESNRQRVNDIATGFRSRL